MSPFAEAGTLSAGLDGQSFERMDETTHMVIALLVTMNCMFSALVAVVLFLAFSLATSSMYGSRTMTFSAWEVSTAQRMAKMSFATLIFLALFVVEVSAISVVRTTAATLAGMILVAHLAFIAAYVLVDLALSAVSLPGGLGAVLLGRQSLRLSSASSARSFR